MLNTSDAFVRVPLRLMSAALLKTFGVKTCSYCRRRIVGLPYAQGEAQLRFCNSECFYTFRRKQRV